MATIPLPPVVFQKLVCGRHYLGFETVGKLLVDHLDQQGMLVPGTDFLDVGCGCGRVARHLVSRDLKAYTGFDRHPGMINWCRTEIRPLNSAFQFDFFDMRSIYSIKDYHLGRFSAAEFSFPYANDRFDSVLLASVFTHMPLGETANYLREIHRVLNPAGRVLLSVFHSQGESFSNDIHFHYKPEEFLEQVRLAGFTSSLCSEYGLKLHHWYLLEKRADSV